MSILVFSFQGSGARLKVLQSDVILQANYCLDCKMVWCQTSKIRIQVQNKYLIFINILIL